MIKRGESRGTWKTIQGLPEFLFVRVASVFVVQWIKMQLVIAQKRAAEC